jgi:hypothetical protein
VTDDAETQRKSLVALSRLLDDLANISEHSEVTRLQAFRQWLEPLQTRGDDPALQEWARQVVRLINEHEIAPEDRPGRATFDG